MSAGYGFFGRFAALPGLRGVDRAGGVPRSMATGAARSDRLGWLRAALLGAQDGIVATATLLVGVAAAGVGRGDLPIVGLACLAAGALAVAAGEYLAASPQAADEDAGRRRRPLRVAFAAAGAFAGGASLPVLVALAAPIAQLVGWLVASSLFFLCALAATAASAGRRPLGAGLRAALWGGAAMAGAAAIGSFSGPLV